MIRLFYLLLGYIFGLLQTGYFISRILGIDLSKQGSGNTGATNSLRVMGKKIGALVFLGDFLKALIPCLIVRIFTKDMPHTYVYLLYAGLGAVLGHIYPFYLGFKGGKGVACTAGILVALDLRLTLAALLVFVIVVAISRYVSLASILVMCTFVLLTSLFSFNILIRYDIDGILRLEFIILVVLVALISIWKHRTNISRLLSGSENKIF